MNAGIKYKNIKMESKDELKEIDVKNRTCFHFDCITKDVDKIIILVIFY